MGWKESSVMHERCRFVLDAMARGANISELCGRYGVSRKTGYKWLERYQQEGPAGLYDRSRRPHNSSLVTSGEMVVAVIRLRLQWSTWGPKKIQVLLLRRFPPDKVPSQSTIGRILQDCGLTRTKGRGRPRRWHPGDGRGVAAAPNDLWTVDFKGWWHTRDGRRCEPLTIRDGYSRYVLALRGMTSTRSDGVRRIFEEVFEQYGLPKVIRSDNGGPFACTRALAGLTRLSAWWKALGIGLDRIEPGHPEQNGGHERMHRDIRQELQSIGGRDLKDQQERFDLWRMEFNTHRPHEALEMKTPTQLYRLSPRLYTGERPQVVYPAHFQVRPVRHNGDIRFAGGRRFVSEALAGWPVGLESLEQGRIRVWFADLCLGETDASFRSPLRATVSAGIET
jgi:transposase InsO family protein